MQLPRSPLVNNSQRNQWRGRLERERGDCKFGFLTDSAWRRSLMTTTIQFPFATMRRRRKVRLRNVASFWLRVTENFPSLRNVGCGIRRGRAHGRRIIAPRMGFSHVGVAVKKAPPAF
ncbi:hypothetical protein ACJRO7_023103 [Eucalyptus globulus]|uniref:Uncharacterized protein n=1 Tax=Eucalyptus globulus TaxID=34317 RepID=A0ABD3K471_EUCGL